MAHSSLNLGPCSGFNCGADLFQYGGFHLCTDLLSRAFPNPLANDLSDAGLYLLHHLLPHSGDDLLAHLLSRAFLNPLANDLSDAGLYLLSHLLPHSGDDLLAYLLARAFLHLLPDDLRHSGFDLRPYLFPRGFGDRLDHLLIRTFAHLAGNLRIDCLPYLPLKDGVRLLVDIIFDIREQFALQTGELLTVVVYCQRVQFDMQFGKVRALFLQAVVGGIDNRLKDLPRSINQRVAVLIDL